MIYVHVPYCRSFCTYCDFYSEICRKNASQQVQNRIFGSYADAVCDEIVARRPEIDASRRGSGDAPDTLYFGGGTPSVLPVEVLERIVDALGSRLYEEFTVEVNPDDIVSSGVSYVRRLLDLGVNRVSMGVQSMDDGILRWMNRRHDAAAASEAVGILREGGVKNISIDLIFGLSQLSDAQWTETLEKALQLPVEHISAYQLSIEEGSALGKMTAEGRYTEASDEQCRRQYDILCGSLRQAGFNHYEISNWARPGFEAVHNAAYWRRVPYVGLGPGAHSFSVDPEQRRSWNSELQQTCDGSIFWTASGETLSAQQSQEEMIMLALRTAAGLPLSALRGSQDIVRELMSSGALVLSDGRVRIPEDHFFVSDDIISSLF